MTLTHHQANYSTPPTYRRVLHLKYSIRISSFRKCPVKWEDSFIEPTPQCPDSSPHFLVERNTFLHGEFEGNSPAPLIGRRGVRAFFLFFLFVLTMCEKGRRGIDTNSYTMSTWHSPRFMTELDSSVDLYEIFHLLKWHLVKYLP